MTDNEQYVQRVNKQLLEPFAERLLKVTAACRYDMHEPDNVGIGAFVTGTHLDNAFGDVYEGGELLVTITEELPDYDGELFATDGELFATADNFNLATLIALARIGANHLLNKS